MWRSAHLLSKKCLARAKFSSRRRQASVFRWSRLTVKLSPTVTPAACHRKFVKPFSTLRKRLRFDTKILGDAMKRTSDGVRDKQNEKSTGYIDPANKTEAALWRNVLRTCRIFFSTPSASRRYL